MKYTIIVSAAAAIAIAAVGFGLAGAAQGPSGMRGPGHFAGIPGLTDTQRADIRKLVNEDRQAHEAQMKQLQELRGQLQNELYANAPNTGRIEELKGQLAAAEAERLAARVDLQLRIAALLTPEQRAAAREGRGATRGRPGRPGPGGACAALQ